MQGHKVGIGAIFGIVTEEGVIKEASPVYLYERDTGRLISKQLTAPDGGFVFNGLNEDEPAYLVMATDEDGAIPKNALVEDRVHPISGHSGATYPANWQTHILASRPEVAYVGHVAEGIPQAHSPNRARFAGAQIDTMLAMTPAAYTLPAVSITDGAIVFPAQRVHEFARQAGDYYKNPFEVSLEWVFDPTSVPDDGRNIACSAIYNSMRATHALNSPRYVDSAAQMVYDASTKLLTVYSQNGSTATNGFMGSRRELFTYDLSLITGPIHLVLTIVYGVEARLYLNGAEVHYETAAISGTNVLPHYYSSQSYYYAYPVGVAVSGVNVEDGDGYSPLGRFGTVNFGAAAGWFHRALTAAEAAEHYSFLFEDQQPVLGGYIKEVTLNRAIWVYRLNDADLTVGCDDFVTRRHPEMNRLLPSNVTTLQSLEPTNVTGGNGIVFDGSGGFLGFYTAQGFHHRYEASFVFTTKFSGVPAAPQTLFRGEMRSSNFIYDIRRDVEDRLVLRINEGDTDVSYVFDYPLALDVWHWLAITVDKAAGEVRLWMDDGLGNITSVATMSTSQVELPAEDYHIQYQTYTQRLHVGGVVATNRTSISDGFVGGLSEVAFFPHTLTESRLQRLLEAKDVA